MSKPTLDALHPLYISEEKFGASPNSDTRHGSAYMRTPQVSRSFEFNRAYQAGDPISMIDWRVYARSDQLIVREEKKASRLFVEIILEVHSSMEWPETGFLEKKSETRITKLSLGVRMLFNLAYRHLRAGDRVDIVLLDKDSYFVDSISSPTQILNYFSDLERVKFSKKHLINYFKIKNNWQPRGGLRYWISDLCHGSFPAKDYFNCSKKFVFLHVLSSLEVDVSWLKKNEDYFDHDSKLKEYKGKELLSKGKYQKSLNSWLTDVKNFFYMSGCEYLLFHDKLLLTFYTESLTELARKVRMY